MSKPRSAPRRRVDGVLLLDKSSGLTSNDALQKVRRLYNAAKAGHTGTLDPLATGLLPLCFGEATKFSGELLDADKTYIATLQLGVTTDTADAEGRVLETQPVVATQAEFEAALGRFLGAIEQVPPMYSALKKDGKPLYAYARAGIEIERAPRRVTIHALRLLDFAGERAEIEVACSKGTYVRTLAADIGVTLGCGAHLSALRRTRIGSLDVADAHSLDDLAALDMAERDGHLRPVDSLLAGLPEVPLNAQETVRIRHGQGVRWNGEEGARFRLLGLDGGFLGVGELNAEGWLNPKRLIVEQGVEMDEKNAPNF